MGHTVRLEVVIDGEFFTTYAADGAHRRHADRVDRLLVLGPGGRSWRRRTGRLLLTPVSPHMLFDRTLVLEPDALELRLVVQGHRPATLQRRRAQPAASSSEGDGIVCTAAPRPARLVTFGAARLPPDPEGEVRPGGPVGPTAMIPPRCRVTLPTSCRVRPQPRARLRGPC